LRSLAGGSFGEDAELKFRVEVPWRRAASETREHGGGSQGRVVGADAELKFRV
jgi:hypothetical protein